MKMNVDTGELFKIFDEQQLKLLRELHGDSIQSVPEKLQEEAKKELAGRDQAVVDMTKNSPLVNWAHHMREYKTINVRGSHLPNLFPPSYTAVRKESKTGRNSLCPCGSGKKYKKCCGK
jgi:preprotein translocase subunit SecA